LPQQDVRVKRFVVEPHKPQRRADPAGRRVDVSVARGFVFRIFFTSSLDSSRHIQNGFDLIEFRTAQQPTSRG
jgi:hypothetical protein